MGGPEDSPEFTEGRAFVEQMPKLVNTLRAEAAGEVVMCNGEMSLMIVVEPSTRGGAEGVGEQPEEVLPGEWGNVLWEMAGLCDEELGVEGAVGAEPSGQSGEFGSPDSGEVIAVIG